MSEYITVDARGLSCPQPVVETKKAMGRQTGGTIEVLVDTVTSRENVSRLARNQGWNVSAEDLSGGGFRVFITKA
ncbi:MAG: sulfurtransferase TusA family protein [Thermovirgaceae bacterium]|nr:sulfurtransferase TusA family protein [Thermovirgaceae bacterium]